MLITTPQNAAHRTQTSTIRKSKHKQLCGKKKAAQPNLRKPNKEAYTVYMLLVYLLSEIFEF